MVSLAIVKRKNSMQSTTKSSLPNRGMTVLCGLAITLAFTFGSALAVEVSEEDYKLLQKIKQEQDQLFFINTIQDWQNKYLMLQKTAENVFIGASN
jgi:sugar diacid utilization regulator